QAAVDRVRAPRTGVGAGRGSGVVGVPGAQAAPGVGGRRGGGRGRCHRLPPLLRPGRRARRGAAVRRVGTGVGGGVPRALGGHRVVRAAVGGRGHGDRGRTYGARVLICRGTAGGRAVGAGAVGGRLRDQGDVDGESRLTGEGRWGLDDGGAVSVPGWWCFWP